MQAPGGAGAAWFLDGGAINDTDSEFFSKDGLRLLAHPGLHDALGHPAQPVAGDFQALQQGHIANLRNVSLLGPGRSFPQRTARG